LRVQYWQKSKASYSVLYFCNFAKVDQAQFSGRAAAPTLAWMMWKTLTCRALCFFWILSDYGFRCMYELFAKTTLVHRKPIRVNWKFSSLLCVGHTKRRRINQDCYFFSIGIYPHLQPIGVECAVRVYPTLEKGDLRSKLPKARNKKLWSICVCFRHCPWGILSTKFIMDTVSFILMKKPIEVSQIPRILASTIWPTCQTSVNAQPFVPRPSRVERLF